MRNSVILLPKNTGVGGTNLFQKVALKKQCPCRPVGVTYLGSTTGQKGRQGSPDTLTSPGDPESQEHKGLSRGQVPLT